MLKLFVTNIATVLKPSTTASATAAFPGCLDGAALGTPADATYQRLARLRVCFCWNAAGVENTQRDMTLMHTAELLLKIYGQNRQQYIQMQSYCIQHNTSTNAASARPTFASLDALEPCMFKLFVPCMPAILEPSTAASTAASFTRFVGSSTLGACETHHYWRPHGERRHRGIYFH